VVAVLATQAHLLWLAMAQQVVVQQVVAVVDRRATEQVAHAVRAVLAVMGSYLFMKYLHNESLRDQEQHRPEHHRAGLGERA
jgi:orotate phosphoribosyltransferase